MSDDDERADQCVRQTVFRVGVSSLVRFALAFELLATAVAVPILAVLWQIGRITGAIRHVEGLIEDLGFEEFHFDGAGLLRGFVFGALVFTLLSAAVVAIAALVFNAVNRLTGGIDVTAHEHLVVREGRRVLHPLPRPRQRPSHP